MVINTGNKEKKVEIEGHEHATVIKDIARGVACTFYKDDKSNLV